MCSVGFMQCDFIVRHPKNLIAKKQKKKNKNCSRSFMFKMINQEICARRVKLNAMICNYQKCHYTYFLMFLRGPTVSQKLCIKYWLILK